MTDVPPGRTSYDFQHEAQRIGEALNLKGASMTLMCALQEAFEAGRAAAVDPPPAPQQEPEPCGNWTPLKAGVPAPTIADHYGHGWQAGRVAAVDPPPDKEPKP